MEKLKYWLLRVLGAALAGFAVSDFFTPNKIVSGGVSGLAIIVYHLFSVPTAVTMIVANIVLLICGMKMLGRKFICNTVVGAILLSVFVAIFSELPALTNNVLLATIFGGVLYGIGLGIVFSTGSTSGGTDILSRMIQYKFPKLPIGTVLMIVDGLIISVSLVVFKEIELTLFGIVALFLSSYSINWFISKLNLSVIAFVISDKGEEIAERLVSSSTRGVTILDALGAYTKADKKVLFCALKEKETDAFQRKLLEIDKGAFVVFSESQIIWGKGFYIYY